MNSRNQILARVRNNQPPLAALPDMNAWENKPYSQESLAETFRTVAANVGSQVIGVQSIHEVKECVQKKFLPGLRIVTSIPELCSIAEDCALLSSSAPHMLENVELAILKASFAVAENSAAWLIESMMGGVRSLPFICQHLALIINAADLVPDMHAAYVRIAEEEYGFATFIAGPSKTADIEQSLVLGAHGPRSLTVFLLSDN